MGSDKKQTIEDGALLTSVALELRLPLLQIKTALQLGLPDKTLVRQMADSVDSGLRLIEAYSLATSLYQQHQLPLEPVSIGGVMEEVTHELQSFAAAYDTGLQLSLPRSLQPVIAHRRGLLAAFNCLTQAMIRAQPGCKLVLGAHRTGSRVMAGVFGLQTPFANHMLKEARQLTGRARQPLPRLATEAASGILVADQLFVSIAEPLSVASFKAQRGLVTHFKPSQQLALV